MSKKFKHFNTVLVIKAIEKSGPIMLLKSPRLHAQLICFGWRFLFNSFVLGEMLKITRDEQIDLPSLRFDTQLVGICK